MSLIKFRRQRLPEIRNKWSIRMQYVIKWSFEVSEIRTSINYKHCSRREKRWTNAVNTTRMEELIQADRLKTVCDYPEMGRFIRNLPLHSVYESLQHQEPNFYWEGFIMRKWCVNRGSKCINRLGDYVEPSVCIHIKFSLFISYK